MDYKNFIGIVFKSNKDIAEFNDMLRLFNISPIQKKLEEKCIALYFFDTNCKFYYIPTLGEKQYAAVPKLSFELIKDCLQQVIINTFKEIRKKYEWN